MKYAYASTLNSKGHFDHQITSIKSHYPRGVILLSEVITKSMIGGPGPEMKKILDKIQKGDTFIALDVPRIARTKEDAWNIYLALIGKGVNVIFLECSYLNSDIVMESFSSYSGLFKEDVSVEDFLNRDVFIKNVFDYQFERFEIANENRQAGRIAAAMAQDPDAVLPTKGKTYVTARFDECRDYILQNSAAFDGKMKDNELISKLFLSRKTYYKYKKILAEQRRQELQQTESEKSNLTEE